MSKIKDALNEAAKKKKSEPKKMLPKLHTLDDTIEKFIQELEGKINAVKDNPIFVRNAHQLLGDMSKEYSEFMFALRALVNACDRKGMSLPKEKPIGRVRDVNSRHRSPDENQENPEDEAEAEEAPPPKGVKEALMIEGNIGQPIVKKIIGFIDARHMGDAKTTLKLQKELKKKLGNKFGKTLLMYGDPDDPKVGYTMVRNKWSNLL